VAAGTVLEQTKKDHMQLALRASVAYKEHMGIYDDIREAIKASPKSRYRLAREMGLNESSLCRLMKGTRGLSVVTLERLAELLGHDVVLKPRKEKD
jgi:hypothetical protein